jgi:hypothetical protein
MILIAEDHNISGNKKKDCYGLAALLFGKVILQGYSLT